MRLFILISLCFISLFQLNGQKQTFEMIYDLSSSKDSVLVYYHLQTHLAKINKKTRQFSDGKLLYMSPDEVLIDKENEMMTIDGGGFSLIEIRAKNELIDSLQNGVLMYNNKTPFKMHSDFNLSAFVWIFPQNTQIMDYSCNSRGKFTKMNSTIVFTAKNSNNLQFEIKFKEKVPIVSTPHPEPNSAQIESICDTIILNTVYYNSGEWKHNTDDQERLKELASDISELEGNYRINVSGFTDNTTFKSNKTNWNLSAQRAADIVNCLIKLGVPEDKISASFFAATEIKNGFSETNQINRRVEILVFRDAKK